MKNKILTAIAFAAALVLVPLASKADPVSLSNSNSLVETGTTYSGPGAQVYLPNLVTDYGNAGNALTLAGVATTSTGNYAMYPLTIANREFIPSRVTVEPKQISNITGGFSWTVAGTNGIVIASGSCSATNPVNTSDTVVVSGTAVPSLQQGDTLNFAVTAASTGTGSYIYNVDASVEGRFR